MSLLSLIKQNHDARKVFGKRELKIIEKQLYGVNLTQSEKNRLSRDIRKKLEFISKISRFEDEFKLKKGAEVKKLVEEAKQAIVGDMLFSRVKEVILYGSSAEKSRAIQSDIDIAVRFSNISLKEATLFRKRVSGKVSDRADIQVFNILPIKIQKEIEAKGRVIYK